MHISLVLVLVALYGPTTACLDQHPRQFAHEPNVQLILDGSSERLPSAETRRAPRPTLDPRAGPFPLRVPTDDEYEDRPDPKVGPVRSPDV